MIKNLPLILLILLVLYVLFATKVGDSVKAAVGMGYDEAAELAHRGPQLVGGMQDIPDENAFGTTEEADRRITNDGVRKEFHKNPFPYALDTCANGGCAKAGIPDPAMGQQHWCMNGFPSKRVIDANGGHFQLNHICSQGLDYGCGAGAEPVQLGRWFKSRGCSCPESIGLSVRPACTTCK